MQRTRFILCLALAAAAGTDAFKFMSNWQAPKILTDDQKVAIAKTEERFGDKSASYLSYYRCHCKSKSPLIL